MSWKMPVEALHIPTGDHPGAYGAQRKHEIHTGVDLYVADGSPVCAVEDGTVVGVEWFTGPQSDPPSPWWLPTQAVLVEGGSGVVLYGEIITSLAPGTKLNAGDAVGYVRRVLRNDKGLPTSMLHLELHRHGTRASSHPWTLLHPCPESLMDPTPFLVQATDE